MGRPRKRPRDEADVPVAPAAAANKTPMLEVPPDTEDPGLAFLSFLSGGDYELDPTFDPTLPSEIANQQQEKIDLTFGYTGNDFGTLDFDTTDQFALLSSALNIDPALSVTAISPLSESQVPRLSSTQSASPSSNESPPSLGPTNCACLAGLYLSLDSMQKLSDDVTQAVRQARLATKTAYQVVNCSACSIPPDTHLQVQETDPAPFDQRVMHNFQLLMLLSTLIPSVVHAYERILTMVDRETQQAQAERREIAFTLENYGGMWGSLMGGCYGGTKALEHRMMEPSMWRLMVRALLRVDVYGISTCDATDSGSAADPFHLGLKDIVIQMENRSKSRHAIMDPLIMAGKWGDPQCVLKMHKTGETPTCQKIIQIARQSIDNLVIA